MKLSVAQPISFGSAFLLACLTREVAAARLLLEWVARGYA